MSKEHQRQIISRASTSASLIVRRRSEPAWPEQYDRMQRMLARLEHPSRVQQELLDDLMVFFQSAWHLKDWIRNDENVPSEVRESIQEEVSNREALLICRDLAVGGKHFELWPVPGRPKALLGVVTKRNTTTRLGGGRVRPEVTTEESSEGVVVLLPPEIEDLPEGEHDAELDTLPALGLARDVVAAWDELLVEVGLRV